MNFFTRATRRLFATANRQASADDAEYIAKRLSRSGYCSRRMALKLLQEGRIRVNQTIITSANPTARPEDIVQVDQRVIPYVPPLSFPGDGGQREDFSGQVNAVAKLPTHIQLYSIYKPARMICTNYDPKQRRTIIDYLEELEYKKYVGDNLPLFPVGRLDYQAEGLFLLTTSGELKRRMEHPASKYKRHYVARTVKPVTDDQLTLLLRDKTVRRTYTSIKRLDSLEVLQPFLSLSVHSHSLLTAQSIAEQRLLMITMQGSPSNSFRLVLNEQGIVLDKLVRIGFGPYTLGSAIPGQLVRTKIQAVPAAIPAPHPSAKKR